MKPLKDRLEDFIRENLFKEPSAILQAFKDEFDEPNAVMFKDLPEKPESNPADAYLLINGTEIVAVMGNVRAELQGR